MRLSGLFLGVALGFSAMAAAGQTTAPQNNSAMQAIRTAGYNAGFHDGVTDYQNRAPYDFQSQPTYQNAAQNYNDDPNAGQMDEQTYTLDFRTGYESGYDDGYYGRSGNAGAQRQRSYNGQAAPVGTQPGAQPSRRAPARPRTNAAAESASGVLPAGTALNLKLNNTLSTRTSQQGDTFTATVSEPVYAADGQTVLVPQGSTVHGTVASVQRSGAVSGNSQVQLNFRTLQLPDGTSLPLRAGVSQVSANQGVGGAITGSPSTTNEGGVQQSQTRNTVGTAAAGGAVGAIIGAIAGGGKGAGIGGIVGAGLGVVLANRNGNLDLPAGTPMTITLSQPIQIR